MPVTTPYEFNFTGTDVPNDSTLGFQAAGAQSETLTENGVTFTYSVQTGATFSNFSTTAINLSINVGTATLDLNETVLQDQFSQVKFNFSSVSGTANSIKLIQTKTASGATLATNVTQTLTNAQIVAGTVTAAAGSYNKIVFTAGGTGYIGLDSITAAITCFMPGTAIATENGETLVEDLQAGDMLRTADGGLTPVKWLAWQTIDPRVTHPAIVNPICIRAGALADNTPSRDLFVSPDHALEIDGTLYNASALVNGQSIYRVAKMAMEPFRYYHVETDAHDLILAEGAATESYLNMPSRGHFDNGADAPSQEQVQEMPLPRISSPRLVPTQVAAYLAERAARIATRAA